MKFEPMDEIIDELSYIRYLNDVDRWSDKKDLFPVVLSNEHPTEDLNIAAAPKECILCHNEDSIDFKYVKNGSLPLLWEHRRLDVLGKVLNVRIENQSLVGEIKFSPSKHAQEMKAMVLSRAVKYCSIGLFAEPSSFVEKDGQPYIKRWGPFELSLSTIPKNNTVGVNEVPRIIQSRQYKARQYRQLETHRHTVRESEIRLAVSESGLPITSDAVSLAIDEGWSLNEFCKIHNITMSSLVGLRGEIK